MKFDKTTIQTICNHIQDVTNLLYQEKINEGMVKLKLCIGEMEEMISLLYVNSATDGIMHINFDDLLLKLAETVNAMEAKDYVLLADLLQYEVHGQFEELLKKV